ncbi:protein NEOXANTHIN-DEFICIENT 1 isoform X2 [Senna tora]|uniref:Protein NEOXANTHIN-DEFICIENT 1 isoform X2 n=1 Tax=Senna tora TaxID=362788 RepID=A0A834X7J0_9FABA|nr:protein NEOXANTHIN-DEFICIENT 1 isoform X2 [Senna tora]
MESGELKCSSTGALYQLHLVRAETARACIPKEFRLVEVFGYTLGGFYLANYEDSPAGVFDELVVMAGLVWNRPTSCAWATRVYVNSDEACNHGRKEFGLPSQVASFSKRITAISRHPKVRKSGFFNTVGIGFDATLSNPKDRLDVQVTEIKCLDATDMCNFSLTSAGLLWVMTIDKHVAVPALNIDQWMGPAIRMSLPSFSGATKYNPNLLKYSCQIECRVRAVKPWKVSRAMPTMSTTNDEREQCGGNNFSTSVMFSKPILALKFSEMKMQVEAPIVLSQSSSNSLEPSVSVTVSAVP